VVHLPSNPATGYLNDYLAIMSYASPFRLALVRKCVLMHSRTG
jgi:hypothetical protein